ncbi:MAG: Gfo/Idh/MocA family oxidoreductase [Limnochordia bacterium]|jgi:predicted dehydrogenase|nr:Gfo/Idh/MocA family oxidoreductase [Bacillota bacterium]HOB09852.1 Gfo/Idh/MocA family oxidoreductase [Limnochordia bacterium]NLH30309.1 Gfo/Idh/MocA family oxidoreductase [Bacillota bacterium]HPT94037.1 Gfo/Idh/MocA family oxidoreductase [Limnochordia bacterium]HPZ31763.1 Gfo/Idh/MocA family oxidoreductase [Limnochordia bacterium]
MDRLRVGIIGCGGIANGKHLPAVAKIPEAEMVAFCDIILSRAEAAKTKYGTKDAKVYRDYEELLADPSIDVVHVLTPNKWHAPMTIAALQAGKHVMCEKPMAKTAVEARAMVEAAKATGKLLTIGYQNRYRSDVQYLHNVCRAGELGEIYFAKAHALRRNAVPTWGVFLDAEAQGGGPLIDIGTHALDLTLWLMDNYEPKYVVGTVYRKLAENRDKALANSFGPWDPKEYTVEDSAFGFVVMKNGATVFLESSWALNTLEIGEAQTTLCGTLGGADMRNGLRINGQKYGKHFIETPQLGAGGVDFYQGESMDPNQIEARVFYDAILEGKPLVVKPEEALLVTEILEAIYESGRTGKPVFFG